MKVLESGAAQTVKVIATVPILCENGKQDCKISVRLLQTHSYIMLSKCTLVFPATQNINSVQTFTVVAKKEFVDRGVRNVKVTQEIHPSPGASTGGDWSGSTGGASMGVSFYRSFFCSVFA